MLHLKQACFGLLLQNKSVKTHLLHKYYTFAQPLFCFEAYGTRRLMLKLGRYPPKKIQSSHLNGLLFYSVELVIVFFFFFGLRGMNSQLCFPTQINKRI